MNDKEKGALALLLELRSSNKITIDEYFTLVEFVIGGKSVEYYPYYPSYPQYYPYYPFTTTCYSETNYA